MSKPLSPLVILPVALVCGIGGGMIGARLSAPSNAPATEVQASAPAPESPRIAELEARVASLSQALEAGLSAVEHLGEARQPSFDASDATGDVMASGLVGALMGGVGIGAGGLLLGAGELMAPVALAGLGAAAAPLAMLAGGALAATALSGQTEALTAWLGQGLGASLDPAEHGLARLWRGAGAASGLAAPPPRARGCAAR